MPKASSALDLPHMAPTRNPGANRAFIYPKSDGLWYTRTSAGVESLVSTGGSDSGWVTLTLAANWTNELSAYGWPTAQVRKLGPRVEVRGLPTRQTSAAAAGTVIATLGVGYRPGTMLMRQVPWVSGTGRLDVDTAGQIYFQTALAIGNWVSIDFTFIAA